MERNIGTKQVKQDFSFFFSNTYPSITFTFIQNIFRRAQIILLQFASLNKNNIDHQVNFDNLKETIFSVNFIYANFIKSFPFTALFNSLNLPTHCLSVFDHFLGLELNPIHYELFWFVQPWRSALSSPQNLQN